jgi:hypothetical protein
VESLSPATLRPAQLCQALLSALEASEGRRRKRKRDQTADAIGLTIKRELLEHAVEEDPAPDAFEEWLLGYSLNSRSTASVGAIAAMARAVLEEWRLVHRMTEFKSWLELGAPSDDTDEKRRSVE